MENDNNRKESHNMTMSYYDLWAEYLKESAAYREICLIINSIKGNDLCRDDKALTGIENKDFSDLNNYQEWINFTERNIDLFSNIIQKRGKELLQSTYPFFQDVFNDHNKSYNERINFARQDNLSDNTFSDGGIYVAEIVNNEKDKYIIENGNNETIEDFSKRLIERFKSHNIDFSFFRNNPWIIAREECHTILIKAVIHGTRSQTIEALKNYTFADKKFINLLEYNDEMRNIHIYRSPPPIINLSAAYSQLKIWRMKKSGLSVKQIQSKMQSEMYLSEDAIKKDIKYFKEKIEGLETTGIFLKDTYFKNNKDMMTKHSNTINEF